MELNFIRKIGEKFQYFKTLTITLLWPGTNQGNILRLIRVGKPYLKLDTVVNSSLFA